MITQSNTMFPFFLASFPDVDQLSGKLGPEHVCNVLIVVCVVFFVVCVFVVYI